MEEQDYSIFISHAAVDEEIAGSIKEFIGKAFPRERVFVSSDPEDLKLGDEGRQDTGGFEEHKVRFGSHH
jgi:hypothetical protein